MAEWQERETGGGETAALRDRLVRAAEIEAERTLSLIRIAVAVTLAAVLIAAIGSLPDLPPETVRRQVLIALGVLAAYALIGLVSLQLACEARFRTWHPWAFTAADCGLVVFNLWSTAVNLELAGSTLWVFPATWLIPLVLVFGVLRYRPMLQGATVVALGVGLVSLFTITESLDAQLERIGSLLELPPTIVRLVMLGLTGLVLVLAAARRRRLLDRSIREATERANLARYLPPEIAALLASGDTARLRQGWQHPIGLLIVDIRGFTGHAERLEPPAITALLESFRGIVIDTTRAYGGIVDKFVGDNAIIVMGVPDARPDDAARTLACARELLRRVAARRDGEPLRIGIGAHFGEAFVGALGTAERLEFTVLGDTVNVTARLEQLTRETDGGLIASEDLLIAAGEAAPSPPADGNGHWQMLGEHALRGRRAPIDVYLWGTASA